MHTGDPALQGVGHIVLADTVGFIRHLPHDLVEAFRSTLEETCEANVLLHVIDANDPEREAYIEQVNQVLQEIGAEDIAQIRVYNKIDLTDSPARIDRNEQGMPVRVWVSAQTGEGMELLQQALSDFLLQGSVHGRLELGPEQGNIRAALYQIGAVTAETAGPEGQSLLDILLSKQDFARLQKKYSVKLVLNTAKLPDQSDDHTMSASNA